VQGVHVCWSHPDSNKAIASKLLDAAGKRDGLYVPHRELVLWSGVGEDGV
jgi:hypothetical protein